MSSVYIISDDSKTDDYKSMVIRLKNAGYIVKSRNMLAKNYHNRFSGSLTKDNLIKMRINSLLSCDKVCVVGELNDDVSKLEYRIAELTNKKLVKIVGFYR